MFNLCIVFILVFSKQKIYKIDTFMLCKTWKWLSSADEAAAGTLRRRNESCLRETQLVFSLSTWSFVIFPHSLLFHLPCSVFLIALHPTPPVRILSPHRDSYPI